MKYQITKKQCESKIKGVCEGCGGELEALRTRDNSSQPTYWIGCSVCNKFRHGVDKNIWNIAKKLVVQDGERPLSSMRKNEYKGNIKYFNEVQISSMTSLVERVIYLFTHQPKLN